MTAIWQTQPTNFFDENGLLASGAKAYFYYAGTSTPLIVFQDYSVTTPHAIPVVANSLGVFPPIYLPYVDYRVRILSASNTELYNADYISNPAPPAAAVNDGRVLTGSAFWWMSSIAPDGYVRMNGRTIGPSGSAATELANDTSQSLFTFLYGLPDSIATVSGGRGASAAADWAAAKVIVVPTMQGIVAAGVEGMGATADNRVQVTGSCDVTNGSPDVVVGAVTGLSRDMTMIINGVSSGIITAIDTGTLTVTLDTNYAGLTASGLSFRASLFPDAQQVGSLGGYPTFAQTTAELATHNHAITDPGHTHDLPRAVGGALAASLFNAASALNGTVATGSNTTGITINNNGDGLPSPIIQPTRLGTWIIKL